MAGGPSAATSAGSSEGLEAELAASNRSVWARGSFWRQYANRQLRPVEVMLLVRHQAELTGRVLELGVGVGRIASYLVDLGAETFGIDLSPRMVELCRSRFPNGTFLQGDMSDLSPFGDDSLDAVIASFNVLDIFGDDERRQTLREISRVLRPGGLLVMSSHNRAFLPHVHGPTHVRWHSPLRAVKDLLYMPLRIWRHRRLRGLQREGAQFAIVSDGSHDFSLVHYFIEPVAQFQQLRDEGLEPFACLDLDGHLVEPPQEAPECPELHYLARKPGLT